MIPHTLRGSKQRALYPQVAARREDSFEPGEWEVREGEAKRGGAYCDVTDRVLCVPTDDSPTSRVIRAHEMMHARVSPMPEEFRYAATLGVTDRALVCAEECRVNYLTLKAGFDTTQLADGSEKATGARLARNEEWEETVCFLAGVLNTGGEKPYLAGIRSQRPGWVAPLRVVAKSIREALERHPTTIAASTAQYDDDVALNIGTQFVTLPIATILTNASFAAIPYGDEAMRVFKRSFTSGARRPPSGRFAELTWLHQPEFAHVKSRGSRRKAKPSLQGSHPRYLSRLLSDPQRRIMASPRPSGGGIVLYDQSGSMDLDPEHTASLAKKHPQTLVIGYSHKPGSLPGATPNVWILAKNSKVADPFPSGNVGNGVDGPLLQWAIQQRLGNEPIIWVCDGQVTDSNDHPGEELSKYCADLVRKHGIRMVRHPDQVASALAHPRRMRPSEWADFGRIGRVMRNDL